MAHSLLAGNSPEISRIAGLLRDWGMDVQEHSAGPLTAAETHRSRTDVVVVVCSPATDTPVCPLPSAFGRECAPILLVGGRTKDCLCRGRCWRWTSHEDACGVSMRQSVESCLGRAEWPGVEEGVDQQLLDYVQFLNHEMRSPLAALQNALQILALESPPDGDPRQHFLQIALRNAKRLSSTMAWNEEILAVRERAAAPRWQWQELSALCRRFAEMDYSLQIDLIIAPEADRMRILTDVLLIEALLRQVFRAVQCHSPGMSLRLAVHACPDRAGVDAACGESRPSFSLTFARCKALPADPAAGPVARTGLAIPAASDEDELSRLLDCIICPEAVQLLGAQLVLGSASRDGILLELVLPRIPLAAEMQDPHPVPAIA